MDRKELIDLIKQHLSTREIAERLGKSQTTIRYWLNHYELKTEINPFNLGGVGNRSKTLVPHCEECGESNPAEFYKTKNRCRSCHNQKGVKYSRELKEKAVAYKGGSCSQCGYARNYAALEFHHLDPKEKDINFKTARNWSWERLKVELDKCVLVCGNCHSETHHPDRAMPGF